MRQVNLPLIPDSAIDLGSCFSVFFEKEYVTWFHGLNVINRHRRDDQNEYRLEIARLCANGSVKQSAMARATGLHKNTVMSYVGRLLSCGGSSFYCAPPVRGGAVLTDEKLRECQELLGQGRSRSETARIAGVKKNTLEKAIRDGRLTQPRAQLRQDGSLPSDRKGASLAAAPLMGMGCTAIVERMAASVGRLAGVQSRFEPARSVEDGGVLCAVPALVANGLYDFLSGLSGAMQNISYYYDLTHVFTLLAFMSLLRIKSAEALRREAPEELGSLLGLDRIPEVKCLRDRIRMVSSDSRAVSEWAENLSRLWLSSCPELSGMLYVDGHVRAYYGEKAVLPRRFFSRMRLCLRGITDYWVNDRTGQPFFYVERQTNEGLLAVLRDELVPRLARDIPGADAPVSDGDDRIRFTLVFDREGYSPAFFQEMWQKHRIACLTYRKRTVDEWPREEFSEMQVTLANGADETMLLAERRTALACRDDGRYAGQVPVREIRRLTDTGHQTSIITTNMELETAEAAAGMFARWCQENFFHYMEEEFALDALAGSEATDFPCGRSVVNPAWKEADRARKTAQGKMNARMADLGRMELDIMDDRTKHAEEKLQEKARTLEDVRNLQEEVDGLKRKLKDIPKRLPYEKLPENEKFKGLEPTRKLLMDTIRMVAYRAETAMASMADDFLSAPDTVRSWMKALMKSPADIIPDYSAKTINVIVYPLGEERMNRMVRQLLQTLNETMTVFPGTDMVLNYSLLT